MPRTIPLIYSWHWHVWADKMGSFWNSGWKLGRTANKYRKKNLSIPQDYCELLIKQILPFQTVRKPHFPETSHHFATANGNKIFIKMGLTIFPYIFQRATENFYESYSDLSLQFPKKSLPFFLVQLVTSHLVSQVGYHRQWLYSLWKTICIGSDQGTLHVHCSP